MACSVGTEQVRHSPQGSCGPLLITSITMDGAERVCHDVAFMGTMLQELYPSVYGGLWVHHQAASAGELGIFTGLACFARLGIKARSALSLKIHVTGCFNLRNLDGKRISASANAVREEGKRYFPL